MFLLRVWCRGYYVGGFLQLSSTWENVTCLLKQNFIYLLVAASVGPSFICDMFLSGLYVNTCISVTCINVGKEDVVVHAIVLKKKTTLNIWFGVVHTIWYLHRVALPKNDPYRFLPRMNNELNMRVYGWFWTHIQWTLWKFLVYTSEI